MTTTPTMLGRDPQQQTRTRRVLDMLGQALNSLIRRGLLFQVSAQVWGLKGLLFSGTGNPAASLGDPGDYYIEYSGGVAVAMWLKS